MENARQKAFQKLRPACIDLSSVALKFRGQQASAKEILTACEALHKALVDLGQQDSLDEKLAEYAFFPLSNVFNESQKLSSRCLEVAVQCLQILVSRGWRQHLRPAMGKQLLILLSLLSGGFPARSTDNPPSEELICACFECMNSLFEYLSQAEQHVFDETAAKTIVDQGVYLLLEAITENDSDSVQISGVNALQTLLSQISSRILLASLLPRTVSALTKALKPTTQMRRTHKVLVVALQVLSHVLQAVLADEFTVNHKVLQSVETEVSVPIPDSEEDSTTLDDKWLKATASQVKLALANVVKLRNHGRQEVEHAVFQMCLMVCERCSKALSDSLQLMIETMVMLANRGESSSLGTKSQMLKHLVLSNEELADLLRNSLKVWVNTLPRVMQGNDDRPKQQVLRQVSAAVQILLESGHSSDLLDDSLATSLVESIAVAADLPLGKSLHAMSEILSPAHVIQAQEQTRNMAFEPVILSQKSQSDSLAELLALVRQIKDTSAYERLTRSVMTRIGQTSGNQQLSAIWLSLHFLKKDRGSFCISDLVNLPDQSSDTTPYLISDLYSITLPILLESSTIPAINDWRSSAFALESTVLQANQLGRSYRPELIDTLYPMLSHLGSSEPHLQVHAMTALNLLAIACEYPNTSTMLIENVDYLINSIALKLNTFDISPQGPQVLLMLLRLCGAKLIPFLDDLIGSIFAVLDSFHGYPQLVELLFDVLGGVVDEAAKNPILTIISGMEEPKHRKTACQPSTIEDILKDIRAYKERQERLKAESLRVEVDQDSSISAPPRPWTSELDGPLSAKQEDDAHDADTDEDHEFPPDQPVEEEKEPPLSKRHSLLLSIARSTIPHLSSPSPRVRLTLLQLLTRIAPILSRHENSFLPLINDIWPAILPRLFSAERRNPSSRNSEQETSREDPTYINIAAADTISALCIGAGDFMSGRIDDIFPTLEQIYQRIWTQVEQDRARKTQHRGRSGDVPPMRQSATRDSDDNESTMGVKLKGTVDLHIVQPASTSPLTSAPPSQQAADILSPHPISTSISGPTSTSASISISIPTRPSHPQTSILKIHTSLLHLFSTILNYTRISDDIGDAILALVGPAMDDEEAARGDGELGWEEMREALERWNADAVWGFREGRREMERMEAR